jgi:DNA-binding NtrC family response regulator
VQACRTVVLVEDEPLVLESTTCLLVDDGCVVHPATSHDEALEILERNPHVTVVVTDIALSGDQTGLDLAVKVASLWPHVRIIILSGRMRPHPGTLPDNALFCTKPCAPGALTTLVRQCVDWGSASPS